MASTDFSKTPIHTATVAVTLKETRAEHADHNREACDLLLSYGKFPDWVITTAFYSAMHRVQAYIFPYSDSGKTYTNIGQYASAVSSPGHRVSKHEATKRLVKKLLPAISNKYSKLFDICHTARYVQYKASPALAKQARDILTNIELACV